MNQQSPTSDSSDGFDLPIAVKPRRKSSIEIRYDSSPGDAKSSAAAPAAASSRPDGCALDINEPSTRVNEHMAFMVTDVEVPVDRLRRVL